MYSQVNLFLIFVTLQVGIICLLTGPTISLVNTTTYLESTSVLGITLFTSGLLPLETPSSSLLGISLPGTLSFSLLRISPSSSSSFSTFPFLQSFHPSFLQSSLQSPQNFCRPSSSSSPPPIMDTEDPYLAIPNPYLALDVAWLRSW